MPGPIAAPDGEDLRGDLRELVRQTVEDAPDGLPEGGGRRPGRRGAARAHRRPRGLPGGPLRPQARHDPGEAALRTPKPEGMRPATAIVERHRRREASVGEAMVETRLAGVSTRWVEDADETTRAPARPTPTRGPSRRWRRGAAVPSGAPAPLGLRW